VYEDVLCLEFNTSFFISISLKASVVCFCLQIGLASIPLKAFCQKRGDVLGPTNAQGGFQKCTKSRVFPRGKCSNQDFFLTWDRLNISSLKDEEKSAGEPFSQIRINVCLIYKFQARLQRAAASDWLDFCFKTTDWLLNTNVSIKLAAGVTSLGSLRLAPRFIKKLCSSEHRDTGTWLSSDQHKGWGDSCTFPRRQRWLNRCVCPLATRDHSSVIRVGGVNVQSAKNWVSEISSTSTHSGHAHWPAAPNTHAGKPLKMLWLYREIFNHSLYNYMHDMIFYQWLLYDFLSVGLDIFASRWYLLENVFMYSWRLTVEHLILRLQSIIRGHLKSQIKFNMSIVLMVCLGVMWLYVYTCICVLGDWWGMDVMWFICD